RPGNKNFLKEQFATRLLTEAKEQSTRRHLIGVERHTVGPCISVEHDHVEVVIAFVGGAVADDVKLRFVGHAATPESARSSPPMTSLIRPASASHAQACSGSIQPFSKATLTEFNSVASRSQRRAAAWIRPSRKSEKSCVSVRGLLFDTGLYSF